MTDRELGKGVKESAGGKRNDKRKKMKEETGRQKRIERRDGKWRGKKWMRKRTRKKGPSVPKVCRSSGL